MTVEQLNATPLYSEVEYRGDKYFILKIKNGMAILWDPYPGNVSVYIPAAELYIHEYFEPYHKDHTFTPTGISNAPMYWPVSVNGKKGVIVGEEMQLSPVTNNNFFVATVFFPDTETFGEFVDGDLVFATYTPSPMTIQPPVIQPPNVTPIISPPIITPITTPLPITTPATPSPIVESKTSIILYVMVGLGVYLLFFHKKEPNYEQE